MNNEIAQQSAPSPLSDREITGIGKFAQRLKAFFGSYARGRFGTWELIVYGALLVAAAAMRLWGLGHRAVHHDESLHSFYSWQLSQGNGFTHDPLMHGPLQFELNAAIFFIFGDSDYTSRLLYAVAGTVLVALPFFFRDRLGRLGALFTSVLLAFSPALLYFSRFSRNDILMAVWALGLVICMWRYIDEGKNRYIYFAAGLLALAFASKETSYLITALLGLFLVLWILYRNVPRIVEKADLRIGETKTVSAVGSLFAESLRQWTSLSVLRGPAAFLLILITLTLPMWSAAIGIFQDSALLSWSNLTFVTEDGGSEVGSPSGGAILIASLVMVTLMGVSVAIGFLWDQKTWLIAAGIFYCIWVLSYSTFFTNLGGIESGMWRGLGYWIAQQDVARGNQPWYYYFVITPLYEFLPLALAVAAAVYYWVKRRADAFTLFLLYWCGMTLLLFTIASEKMPWLLVNITLPLIVLGGKFLGDLASGFDWRKVISPEGALIVISVPALMAAIYMLALAGTEGDGNGVAVASVAGASVIALAALGVYMARRIGIAQMAKIATIPAVVVLLLLTVRASTTAAYNHGDVPVEMLVYTQTSPDIRTLANEFRRADGYDGEDSGISIDVDDTSGFTWPWAWYLRDSTRYYANYKGIDGEALSDRLPT
ncbi:MAG: TIGR03663 family protein, partial [Chloroflexi bacterium]|nr:TIGR03663 family protein [Chloroflexota bacterium]